MSGISAVSEYFKMKDLVDLMNGYRNNLSFLPKYAWFRDGEESAQEDNDNIGNIEISIYIGMRGCLREFHKRAKIEKIKEVNYK